MLNLERSANFASQSASGFAGVASTTFETQLFLTGFLEAGALGSVYKPSISLGGGGAKGGTTVFRAVDVAEAASIKSTCKFLLNPGGTEVKYFAKSLQDAHWYGAKLYPTGYSIIQGTVKGPVNAGQYWFQHVDIGAYAFPNEILPHIIPH